MAAGAQGGRRPRWPGCRFHQPRHFYASTPLHNGVDIKALAEALGHADAGFTLRIYVHLMPAAEDKIRASSDASLRSDGTASAREAKNH
jgi:integrase